MEVKSFFFYLNDISQIWFQEKMKLLAPPQNIAKYRPKHLRTRTLQKLPADPKEWLASFPDIGVQWMCPWWNIRHVTTRTYTHYVLLARGVHCFRNGRTKNRTDPIRFGSVCIFKIFEFLNRNLVRFGLVLYKKYIN